MLMVCCLLCVVLVVHRLCPRSAASRSISSHASLLSALRRSAPLHALSQPTRSPTEDPTGFDAARESAQHEEIMTWDPTMFALAFASTAALAGAIWWGASDAEKDRAVQEAAMMEDLRAEMAAKFGRSKPAECEEKVQDVAPLMRAAVQASHNKYTPSRGAAIVSALALAEDQPIAPWWRRILGFLLDNFMYNGAAFAGQFLIIKARPDWEDRVNATLPRSDSEAAFSARCACACVGGCASLSHAASPRVWHRAASLTGLGFARSVRIVPPACFGRSSCLLVWRR